MANPSLPEQFENFVATVLERLSFNVIYFDFSRLNIPELKLKDGFRPDLRITKDNIEAYCEVKFYKSGRVSPNYIRTSAAILAKYEDESVPYRVLIVSSYVSSLVKEEIKKSMGVIVWDRSNLANFMAANGADEYLDNFGQFILDAQQGVDTELPYTYAQDTDTTLEAYFSFVSKAESIPIESEGQTLSNELDGITAGREQWSEYENICERILKFLFSDDLSVWSKQQITDDELSRFDLICRIGSQDDFWRTLVNSFKSRYILFEFKNYSGQLPQSQIYTTERYLYPRALRGACIIIARNGASEHAVQAAKGALREQSKLILILDESDIKKMLYKRDQGGSPSDFLSEKLDDFLISLS